MLVQCEFASGTSRTTGFVEQDPRLRPGVQVTLKNTEDPVRWWTVLSIGAPRPRSWLKRGWNNNI